MAYTTRKELLKRVHEGNEAAWFEFAEFYKPLMLLCARDCHLNLNETEELQQNVLLAVFQHDVTQRYDPTKGRFRDYLRRIIKNTAIDIINARKGQLASGTLPEPQEPQNLEERIDGAWREFLYNKALEELRENADPIHYMAFELHGQQGMPAKKVAEMLGLTEAAVFKIKSRLVAKCAEIVKRLEEELGE